MSRRNDNTVKRRNGNTLVVGIVARISGCISQKDVSLEDQEDHAKQVVADRYDGPVEYRVIATKAKGESLDRPELAKIADLIRTRKLDLLIAEDIGRLVRGAEAIRLCGMAVDHSTRVICPNDGIDTADENWEDDVFSACREHVGHNSHTSKRLKQKLMNRFEKYGGSISLPIYGYIVPPEARTCDDWQKDPEEIPIYAVLARKIRATRNCSFVADWLNSINVALGPYARRQKWSGKMVCRLLRNFVLMGTPSRGRRHTIKHHGSGRRVAVKNPTGPKYYECLKLAFFTEEEFIELNALLDEKNRGRGRKPDNGSDPRAGVLRKHTRWPGQQIKCGICNNLYYWGGHGVKEHMMCSGCREYECWNGATFDGVDAANRLSQSVLAEIEKLTNFAPTFREKLRNHIKARTSTCTVELTKSKNRLEEIGRELSNIADAIAKRGFDDDLEEKRVSLKQERTRLQAKVADLKRNSTNDVELPTMEEIKQRAREVFASLAVNSPEFGALMRELVPSLKVFPCRLCDGRTIVLRAKLSLDLAPLTKLPELAEVDGELLRRELVVDLFNPPQRAKYREQIMQMRAKGMTQKEIAKKLGLTITATQASANLHRKMQELQLTDPYIPEKEPPADCTKLRRHLHHRYNFKPRPEE